MLLPLLEFDFIRFTKISTCVRKVVTNSSSSSADLASPKPAAGAITRASWDVVGFWTECVVDESNRVFSFSSQ